MRKTIKEYYKKAGVASFIIDEKLKKFDKHDDIAGEFEYWILNNEYIDKICVEGYKASDLSKISSYLNGEGAFVILIELREDPVGAKERIKNGFEIK